MDRHENEDRELRNYFDAARETDRETAPDFQRVVTRERPARPRRRGQRIAWMATAASAAVVVFAAWLGTHAPPAPEPPRVINERLESPAVEPAPPSHAPTPVRNDGSAASVREPGPPASSAMPVPASEEAVERLRVASKSDAIDLEKPDPAMRFKDEQMDDLPVPGRFYQNVLTHTPGAPEASAAESESLHGASQRDFRAVVSGTSSVAPVPGRTVPSMNPNSIEEMEVVSGTAGVEFRRAQGGFALQSKDEIGIPESLAPEFNTESYGLIEENRFLEVTENPLSTFSIDVDTASYANVRRFLNQGQLPAARRGAHRGAGQLLPLRLPAARRATRRSRVERRGRRRARGTPAHRLVRIGLKGREIDRGQRPASNLVFLIDVSGSMNEPNKLPLVQGGARAARRAARTRATAWRSSSTPARRASCCRSTAGDAQGRDHSAPSSGSQAGGSHERRRRDPARLRDGREQLHQGRHQPRDPRDRRRLQRRRHEPGRAGGA